MSTPTQVPTSLSADLVLRHYPEAARKHRRLRDLPGLLDRFCAAETLRGQLDALERLVRWLCVSDGSIPEADGAVAPTPAPWRRLGVLLGILEGGPEVRAAVVSALAAVIQATDAVPLLAQTGLANDRGLINETMDRLFRRLLPAPRDEHDLARLVLRLFPSDNEVAWVDGMPPDLFARLGEALDAGSADSPWQPLAVAGGDSFCLLGARAQALGLSEDVRLRSRPQPPRAAPFFRLPRSGDALLDVVPLSSVERIGAERTWRADVTACREEMRGVYEHLEATGVSIDVVYGLEVIEQCLARMEALMACLAATPGPERLVAAHRLLVVLVRARQAEQSLRLLMHANLRLLARKIIERAGQTGEHYITTTRREYWLLLASAAGGGVLTSGTAALKLAISAQHFPLFVEGFLSGCNYALSFIIMQLCGFTLATKQPSMTAATLAGIIRDSSGPAAIDELATHVARICRSQLAAAIGNISTVAVAALGLDTLWRWRFGHSLVDVAKAQSVLASLHPTKSLTFWYAMITGGILWLSSLAAGWIENWAVYRRLPQAIAEHRVGRWLGEGTMRWLADAFARNISGVGGSVALGFMLGMAPVLGQFFGLPIDVRHVTLSTGTLVLAVAAHGPAMLKDAAFLWGLAGIGVIFVCNLGVSFTLALTVALRAREVSGQARLRVAGALLRRFLRAPREFLGPPPG